MIKVTSIMIKNINYDKMILMVTKVTSMVSYRFCATQATWPISLLVFPMLLRYVQNWISGHLKPKIWKSSNIPPVPKVGNAKVLKTPRCPLMKTNVDKCPNAFQVEIPCLNSILFRKQP